jgi:RNA polymerase sigma-70 factor, ECF subfamily
VTDPTDRDRTFREEALPQMEAVYRFALRLAQDPDGAQDLVQETFLRAYRSWEGYTLGTQVKSWLFTICRNSFLRHEERARRHEDIVTVEAEEDPRSISREATVFMAVADRDPEGSFWDHVVDDEVLRAIDALPDEFRDAVVLSDLEDLSYDEIAGIMRVPVGTVKSRLFRGRRILQERLYEYAVASGIVSAPADPTPRGKGGSNELDR